MAHPYRLLLIVGARPNFMKIAPIVRELAPYAATIASRLVHTGQHYDAAMSDVFFGQLGIPRPDVDLGVTVIMTAELVDSYSELRLSPHGISFLTDGIILQRYAELLTAQLSGLRWVWFRAGAAFAPAASSACLTRSAIWLK